MIDKNVKQFALDAFQFPSFGRGAISVWRRNYLYFSQTVLTSLSWIFVEPLLYLFALGYGLGHFVKEIDGQSYAQFIAPAMMATSGMFVAFFEGTYSTYTKMTRQFTYQTILLSPLESDEIVIGEILWITTKAFLSCVSVAIVLAALGLVPVTKLAPALAILFLMCWVFAAFGVWLSTLAKSYEWFSYSQSGLITPMSLFCGTYFPLQQLPEFLVYFSYSLPLTHGLMSVRMFLSGDFNSMFFVNLIYLLASGIFLTNLAAARFERRLIS
ncbi:MAG: ABC transporter permease [Bdellovibrionales bacterium]|nr:ABC transporter permease [Bdellovibrionales bacterium]